MFGAIHDVGFRIRTERGFSLLDVTLWLLAFTGIAVATFVGWRVWEAQRWQRDQAHAIDVIDSKVMTYATVYERLPCPDVDRDGFEDRAGENCIVSAQKGWLPWRTLGLEGLARDVASHGMMYLVQRGAPHDLTQRAHRYEPARFERGTGYQAQRAMGQLSTFDWCVALKDSAQAPYAEGDAAVDPAHPIRVAYAVAWPGRMASAQGAFTGVNPDLSLPLLESPQRLAIAGYEDRVYARSAGDLWARAYCAEQLQAMASLSMATDVNEEVQGQKVANFMSATVAAGISTVKLGVSSLKVLLSIKGAITAGAHLSAAISELSAAIAGCAVLVGCALIPKAAAAVAAAAASVAAYVGAAALNATAAAVNLAAAIQNVIPAAQAGVAAFAGLDLTQARDQAASNLASAQATRSNAYNSWQLAQASASTAEDNLDASRSQLVNLITARVNAANASGNCNPANPDHYGCFTLNVSTYTSKVSAYEGLVQQWVDGDAAYQAAQKALEKAQNATSDAPQSPGSIHSQYSPINAVQLLRDRLASESDPQKRIEIELAIDWLSNPANNASVTFSHESSNATQRAGIQASIEDVDDRLAQVNADITRLDGDIGGAPCDPEPSTEPLRTQCRERDLAVQQRESLIRQRASLQQALDHMTMSVVDAQTARDNALATLNTRLGAMNGERTVILNTMGSLPYRYCWSTTTDSGSSAVTTWTCETRNYDGNDDPLSAYIDDLRDKRNAFALKQREVTEKELAYRTALQAEEDALHTKESIDAIVAGGGAGTAAEIMVWQGAADVLRAVDARGGVR